MCHNASKFDQILKSYFRKCLANKFGLLLIPIIPQYLFSIFQNFLGDVAEGEIHMKLKLLFVVNVDWFFLSHRLPIALEALRQGYEVHLATTLTDKIKLLQGYGLVIDPLSLDRSGAGLWAASHEAWQIYRLFKDVKPDVFT